MKNATKVTMAGVAMVFAVAVATSAFGFGWGRGPGMDCGQCPGGPAAGYRGVTLTPEQQAALKGMRDAQFKEIKPLQEQMFKQRDEVRKLWLEANPDKEKIAAAQQAMRSVRDQIEDKMTAFRLDTMKVLTPEQQSQIQSSTSGRGAHSMRGMHGMGPGPCSGGGAGCVGPSAQ